MKDFLPSDTGKFGSSKNENHLIMEFEYFLPLIADRLPVTLRGNKDFRLWLKYEANLTEYTDYIVMTMPSPRLNWYANKDYDTTQRKITRYVNGFINATGFYPIKAKMYLLDTFKTFNSAILMFNLIFKIVIIIFLMISIMLLHSLLMIGIEEKTFEIGIMRMLGESKIGIISIVAV